VALVELHRHRERHGLGERRAEADEGGNDVDQIEMLSAVTRRAWPRSAAA
jgi:hypothetical protein